MGVVLAQQRAGAPFSCTVCENWMAFLDRASRHRWSIRRIPRGWRLRVVVVGVLGVSRPGPPRGCSACMSGGRSLSKSRLPGRRARPGCEPAPGWRTASRRPPDALTETRPCHSLVRHPRRSSFPPDAAIHPMRRRVGVSSRLPSGSSRPGSSGVPATSSMIGPRLTPPRRGDVDLRSPPSGSVVEWGQQAER